MKNFLKHVSMTFLITSTILLWGVTLKFSNLEIMIAAFCATIIYWSNRDE